MEIITVTQKVLREERRVIYEANNVKVKINYFWDSHGNLVPFKRKNKYTETINADRVKVEEVHRVFDEKDDYIDEIQEWNLYINDEDMHVEVESLSEVRKNNELEKIIVKAIVGWG